MRNYGFVHLCRIGIRVLVCACLGLGQLAGANECGWTEDVLSVLAGRLKGFDDVQKTKIEKILKGYTGDRDAMERAKSLAEQLPADSNWFLARWYMGEKQLTADEFVSSLNWVLSNIKSFADLSYAYTHLDRYALREQQYIKAVIGDDVLRASRGYLISTFLSYEALPIFIGWTKNVWDQHILGVNPRPPVPLWWSTPEAAWNQLFRRRYQGDLPLLITFAKTRGEAKQMSILNERLSAKITELEVNRQSPSGKHFLTSRYIDSEIQRLKFIQAVLAKNPNEETPVPEIKGAGARLTWFKKKLVEGTLARARMLTSITGTLEMAEGGKSFVTWVFPRALQALVVATVSMIVFDSTIDAGANIIGNWLYTERPHPALGETKDDKLPPQEKLKEEEGQEKEKETKNDIEDVIEDPEDFVKRYEGKLKGGKE